MSGCKFDKKKGLVLSKKRDCDLYGMDANFLLDWIDHDLSIALIDLEKKGVKNPVQHLLNGSVSGSPAAKHALINKLKELNSSS